jgi:uncharacterized protein
MTKPEIYGIYHKNCNDGTLAGAILLRKYPNARLYPLSHAYSENDLKEIANTMDKSAVLYTLDCALGAREMLELGHKVITLDHHISVRELLEDMLVLHKDFTYIFDNDKSGASLAWQYFFPQSDIPRLVKYVEDSDLGQWQCGKDGQAVNNYLYLFHNRPEEVLEIMESDLSIAVVKGAVITDYVEKQVETSIKMPSILLKVGEHEVSGFNITENVSECGNILSDKLDRAVAMFRIEGGNVSFSFRSKNRHTPSARELAEILGGGGHHNAGGAHILLQDFLKMIIK